MVCQGFGGGKLNVGRCLNLELEGGWDEFSGGVGGLREKPGDIVRPIIVPFVACSKLKGHYDDGIEFLDSDKSYDVSEAKAPLVPPIKQPFNLAKAKAAKM